MKKQSFTEQLMKDKGLIEVSPNMFIKQKPVVTIPEYNPINTFNTGKKKTKYNVSDKSERTLLGKTYDSKIEMQYAQHLLKLVGLKQIKYYEEQVTYQIELNGVKICKYVLDFKVCLNDGSFEYVDIKGFLTPLYRLKKKLMLAQFGIKIKEVKRGEF